MTYEPGPFCPETITDSAEAGGIWFDGNGTYDIDGEFITGLAQLYGDDNWQMYDEDGNVLVTETAEELEAAVRTSILHSRTTVSRVASSGSTTVSRSRPRC